MSEPTKFIEVVSLLVAMTGVFLAANEEIRKAKQGATEIIQIEAREEKSSRDASPQSTRAKDNKLQDRYPARPQTKKKPRRDNYRPRHPWYQYEAPCDDWE